MMNMTKIPFSNQAEGYDQNQVDLYIQKLTNEYNELHGRFAELSNRPAQQVGTSDLHLEAISKAIVDAEVKSIQIVAEAKKEANRIIAGAYTELEQIQRTKEHAALELGSIVERLKAVIPVGGLHNGEIS